MRLLVLPAAPAASGADDSAVSAMSDTDGWGRTHFTARSKAAGGCAGGVPWPGAGGMARSRSPLLSLCQDPGVWLALPEGKAMPASNLGGTS